MSMQDKILAALTKAVTDANPDLEVTNQAQWANTGTLYVAPKDSFEMLLRVGYDFQDRYADLFLIPAKVDDAVRGAAPASVRFAPAGKMCGAVCPPEALAEDAFWAPLDYAKSAEIQAVVDFVGAVLRLQLVS